MSNLVKNIARLIVTLITFSLLVACQNEQDLSVVENNVSEIAPTLVNPVVVLKTEPTTVTISEPTTASIIASTVVPVTEPTVSSESGLVSIPIRVRPRQETTGNVPHVQIGIEPISAVNEELFRRAFLLPNVEDKPTIVSLPGARGMWLSEGVPMANPQAIVNGREFAHIHPDGSLHAPLPYERALEITEKGWGERHPWADDRDGWEGFVMLYTPLSMEELDITFQLIVESYNYVTGQNLHASDFE